ncbi:MEDS domain-containing protein [Streptomyces sp. NPDC050658]|uniref:MEDS domain-containing protein n=1 Tax=unclassified Streptomyces TaxID=2593676 RepID=UPI00342EC0DE
MDASSAPRTVSVTRMNSGDHACLGFDDEDDRWELRAAFTDIGLARGEQVMFFTDPETTADSTAERLHAAGICAEAALRRGQLVVVNEVPGYDPDSGFDVAERAQTWVTLTDQARRQGFSGLRVIGDMGWAAAPDVDHQLLVSYEAGLAPVFAATGFTAMCEYDRRRFGAGLLGRIRQAHPMKVLHRLGALDIARTGGELRIAGDVDLRTRAEFGTALTRALTGPARPTALDLSELCFIDVHSAALLVRLARALPRDEPVAVRCRPAQHKVIRLCGAAEVPQLVLAEG